MLFLFIVALDTKFMYYGSDQFYYVNTEPNHQFCRFLVKRTCSTFDIFILWQLVKEFRKGRAFDGWSEGCLNFAPTYKYEINSDKYVGEDPKAGRRTPAWYVVNQNTFFEPLKTDSFSL